MEYYGLTDKTTIEDLGSEPADFSEFIEWEIKKTLIQFPGSGYPESRQ